MKTFKAIVTTALMLIIGLSCSINASVIQSKTFDDLVIESDMAAIGRVVHVESHPTADQQYAYTYVTVGLLEVLKGTYRQPTITLRMDGGSLGDDTKLVIPGIPEFQPNEKVVLFVKGNGQHICPLVGWEQGLLRVVNDPRTGQEILRTSLGRPIRSINKGKFTVDLADAHGESIASAGVPDYGQSVELNRVQSSKAEEVLNLQSLKQQIRGVLLQAGPKAQPKAQVQSATLTLESPKRSPKQPTFNSVAFPRTK